MPRTVVKEAGWSRAQCFAECGFTMMIEDNTNVIPRCEHHDLAEKEWCVPKRFVGGSPPANAPSNGSQPFRTFFCYPLALHNCLDPIDRSIASPAWMSTSYAAPSWGETFLIGTFCSTVAARRLCSFQERRLIISVRRWLSF